MKKVVVETDPSPIQGWMVGSQLDWLAERAKAHSRIVEIGVWKGRTTVVLAKNTPGFVWAIDPWERTAIEERYIDELAEKGSDAICAEFVENIRPYKNVHVIRATSEEACEQLKDLRFDFVWIDGDHTYESVKGDIIRWGELLEDGGLLAGHDAEYTSVSNAIRELVPGFHIVESGKPFNMAIWWAVKGVSRMRHFNNGKEHSVVTPDSIRREISCGKRYTPSMSKTTPRRLQLSHTR